jgi:hypothetical protein
MIECSSCRTLNSETQMACLVCGASLPAARSAGPAAPQRCPAGPPFDPSWKSCPYCDRAAAQPGGRAAMGEITQREQTAGAGLGYGPQPRRPADSPGTAVGAPAPTAAPRSAAPPAAARPTRLETAEGPGRGQRRTVLAQEPPSIPAAAAQASGAERSAAAAAGPPPAPGGPAGARPLVAVLAAPDFQPGGMLFAVRAGKNTVGASAAADICLARDPKVSDEHALLLYRNGAFLLTDRVSTNGTWVNGREVPPNGMVELLDRDRILCGDVELQLLAIARPEAASPAGAADEETDGAHK